LRGIFCVESAEKSGIIETFRSETKEKESTSKAARIEARPGQNRQLTYLSRPFNNRTMKQNAVRTSVDLPRDLHRRLHEAAARKGCSARKLILVGIERAVEETKPERQKRRLNLDKPLIRPAGRRIRTTNEEAYELIELP
jgi:hypothetical protein